MFVSRIRLTNFRNYTALDYRPTPGLCVLTGENAAGKTNIVESMFLCALGRSHRTKSDAELIRFQQPGAHVLLELSTSSGKREIECRLFRTSGKQFMVDGVKLTRSGELLGCLRVVMFSPEDLRLVKNGPGERRRFLDMELSQLQPLYYYRLQQYNLAIRQRNALLKTAQSETPETLDIWNEQIAALGAYIMECRSSFLARLFPIAEALHGELTNGKEQLRLSYMPSIPGQFASVEEQAAALLNALEQSYARDVMRGYTSIGPHRDDIGLFVNDEDVRSFGSQGQQRTAALCLKLSELELVDREHYEPPVLLLDDVLSELDERRQCMLAKSMERCQTFLTCTHPGKLSHLGLKNTTIYTVKNGCVTAEA